MLDMSVVAVLFFMSLDLSVIEMPFFLILLVISELVVLPLTINATLKVNKVMDKPNNATLMHSIAFKALSENAKHIIIASIDTLCFP